MWILYAICFIFGITGIVFATLYVSLKEPTEATYASKNIVYSFESKNKALSLDEMIEFHKTHSDLKKYQL